MKKSKKNKSLFFLVKKLGPGLITGAADDDPSGIATYSQTGAKFGFQLLWLAMLTLPLMVIVQEMCARIGMVTGQGLAANIRQFYPRPILLILVALLFAANTFNISADLAAMAAGIKLLLPNLNDLWIIFLFATLSTVLQIFISYRNYAKFLKYLCLVLIAYPITVFFIKVEWRQVLIATFIPSLSFSKSQILLICAILGTTISPYLFFWQTSQMVEEQIEKNGDAAKPEYITKKSLRWMGFDVIIGMFVSNVIMFFIIMVCGATLFTHGITDIQDAAQAASALQPFAGSKAEVLFVLGIVGTGLLSIPILAGSSAYAIAEVFHLKEGLYKKFRQAFGFYMVIFVSMLCAFLLNIFGMDPFKTLIYSAIANGIIAPMVLFFVVRLSRNATLMGRHAVHPIKAICGWLITLLMLLSSLGALSAIFF